MNRVLACLTTCFAATWVTACGGDTPPSDAAPETALAPHEVHFTASDFAFEGPTTIESGMVTFVLDNTSANLHHLQLVRLTEGMSAEDFHQRFLTLQPGTPPPAWFVDAGGVNPPAPGQPARVTLMVEPGEYAVVCIVDTPDHVPHLAKGMIAPLTVTPAAGGPAPMPAADRTLTLVDYAFSLDAPLTSGSHAIRVVNGATQSHEIALFRILPGKTIDDVMAWGATYAGEPPMTAAGGVPAIRPGQEAVMHVELTPGEYVALCFVPDANDGAPHVAHGMALPFTIS
ncbi:MAG: hypothetical protein AB7T31_01815 [Gemmatimonadales bacterium]